MAELGRLNWKGDEFQRLTEREAKRRLVSACILVTNTAKENVTPGGPSGFKTSRGGSGLRGSIRYETQGLTGRVGSNLRYARIQELGGIVTPKSARALAIPIHPDAKRAYGTEAFGVLLQLITRPGKPPLLVRARFMGRGGRRQAMDIMYVLVKSATLPPRPYLRPALWNNESVIRELFARPMK